MNPTDLARERHREYARALDAVAKAERVLQNERDNVLTLEQQLVHAERHDQRRLGEAIVAGRREPALQARKVAADLEKARRRVTAVERQVETSHAALRDVVVAHKSDWIKDSLREIVRAESRYRSAIAELEAARAALSGEVGLAGWITSGGEAHPEPAQNALGGDGLPFHAVLAGLNADVDHLVGWLASNDDEQPWPRLELAHRRAS